MKVRWLCQRIARYLDGNFEGEMRVVIDEPPVIMHEGQYLGNVYIHVVDMGA